MRILPRCAVLLTGLSLLVSSPLAHARRDLGRSVLLDEDGAHLSQAQERQATLEIVHAFGIDLTGVGDAARREISASFTPQGWTSFLKALGTDAEEMRNGRLHIDAKVTGPAWGVRQLSLPQPDGISAAAWQFRFPMRVSYDTAEDFDTETLIVDAVVVAAPTADDMQKVLVRRVLFGKGDAQPSRPGFLGRALGFILPW